MRNNGLLLSEAQEATVNAALTNFNDVLLGVIEDALDEAYHAGYTDGQLFGEGRTTQSAKSPQQDPFVLDTSAPYMYGGALGSSSGVAPKLQDYQSVVKNTNDPAPVSYDDGYHDGFGAGYSDGQKDGEQTGAREGFAEGFTAGKYFAKL